LAGTKTGRILELDGWRGVSILLVVLSHLLAFAFPSIVQHSIVLRHFSNVAGELGVRIFFVISGFVITRLLVIEEAKYGSISLKGFYTRRVFRILPVFYFVVITVCVMSWLGWTPMSVVAVMQSALFLKDLRMSTVNWFLGHSWSLAVEEQFYIVFPFFWAFSSPRNRPKVLLATLAAFLAWSVFTGVSGVSSALTLSAIIGFSCINVGALIAIFENRVREFTARVPPVVVLLASVVLLLRPVPTVQLQVLFNSLYEPFALALMLFFTVSRKGWASSALTTAGIQWIGLISYSAYLWQELFTGPAEFYGSPATARVFHLCLPLLIPIAAASYYWIERPSTRLGRRLSAPGRTGEPSTVAPVVPAS